MATTVTKTRTNYFAVKDKEAFANLIMNMETDDGKPFAFENSHGEVGFAADGHIFGIRPADYPEVTKNQLAELKTELLMSEPDEIKKFVNTSVDGWEEAQITSFLDEVIEQKSEQDIREALEYFGIDLNRPEPDELETEMIRQIQAIIKPGHACIITAISYENLKYLDASTFVITEDKTGSSFISDIGLDTARTMLDNKDYNPDMAY